MTEKRVLEAALVLLNRARKHFAEWEEQCREERKQGYAPSACVHGTSRWTDYDNICGPCEDGYGYWDYMTQARLALSEAQGIRAQVSVRIAAAGKLMEIDRSHRTAGLSSAAMDELLDWVNQPWEAVTAR